MRSGGGDVFGTLLTLGGQIGGAAIGSVLFPGLGTAAGTALGGGLGGVLGSALGSGVQGKTPSLTNMLLSGGLGAAGGYAYGAGKAGKALGAGQALMSGGNVGPIASGQAYGQALSNVGQGAGGLGNLAGTIFAKPTTADLLKKGLISGGIPAAATVLAQTMTRPDQPEQFKPSKDQLMQYARTPTRQFSPRFLQRFQQNRNKQRLNGLGGM